MARNKRKAIEAQQSARVTSLQDHVARSSGKPFGKRRADPALWSRRKSLAFVLGASLTLWLIIFAVIYGLFAAL